VEPILSTKLFKAICEHVGVTHTTTTAYRPQCNGANERSHKELHRFLSIYSEKTRPEDWDLLTKEAEWAHNTTYHAGIRRSPYEALRGMSPGLYGLGPAIKERNKLMETAEEELGVDATDDDIIQRYFCLLDQKCLEAQEQVQAHLNRTQEGYQKNLTKEGRYYLNLEPGDKVLLENPGTSVKDKVKKYHGPFLVLKKYSPAVYKIEDPKTRKWQVVNQSRLKKYREPNKFDEMEDSEEPVLKETKGVPDEEEPSPIEAEPDQDKQRLVDLWAYDDDNEEEKDKVPTLDEVIIPNEE